MDVWRPALWPAVRTYEAIIWAAMGEQYVPIFPVPVHYIQMFYN